MNARIALQRFCPLVLIISACTGEAEPPANRSPGAASVAEDTAAAAPEAGAAAAPPRAICDGSQNLRFAVRILGGGPHLEPDMMTSLGFTYLFVRGDCRYWVNPGVFYQWKETRSGMLSAAQEQALSSAFGYSSWGAMAGEYLGQALHNALMQVFDGESVIECNNSCLYYAPEQAPPAPLDRFSDAYKEWVDVLWQAGAASEPALRVSAQRFAFPEPITEPFDLELIIDWPLAWPIDELIAPPEGPGLLLADASRVRELRELRATYADGEVVPGSNNSFLRTDSFVFGFPADRRVQYLLWFRDALPFEDDLAEIPFVH